MIHVINNMGLLSDIYHDSYYNCTIGNIPLHVDVLRTPEQQTKGYQGRSEPGPYEGLLFFYPATNKVGFWMKDVDFHLQLLAFDENDELFQIINMQPNSQMIQMINRPCSKVVEVQRYWCQRNKITLGVKIQFDDAAGVL